MATVRYEPEHERAVGRALAALHAERATAERWGIHSVELTIAIDDLEELRDRMQAERTQVRDRLTAHTNVFPLGRRLSDAWSAS